ncbi:MAG: hypothetical protein M5U28_06910 [Sandaracinaceae bacterium]|nr:hypothetical protein [Sandaracinaceae bacterium]
MRSATSTFELAMIIRKEQGHEHREQRRARVLHPLVGVLERAVLRDGHPPLGIARDAIVDALAVVDRRVARGAAEHAHLELGGPGRGEADEHGPREAPG